MSVTGACLALADRARRVVAPMVALGQLAFTVYVGHLLLWRWPMKRWPWGFSLGQALWLIAGGWLAMCGAAWLWRRRFQRGPLEYLLRAAGRLVS